MKIQELFEQIAESNDTSVAEVKLDLTKKINEVWNNANSQYDIFRTYFKHIKPNATIFIANFYKLQIINDKLQEIIEEICKNDGEFFELVETLNEDQINEPIIYFIAMLNSLKENKPIIDLIEDVGKISEQ